MKLFEKILGVQEPEMEGKKPEFKQNKKYRLCVEDNPNERKYRGCNKPDVCVPNCKISLNLEELTHEEAKEIDLEIRNLLERHNFTMR
jgi:hypothetical protein